jgi:hypothetical protein
LLRCVSLHLFVLSLATPLVACGGDGSGAQMSTGGAGGTAGTGGAGGVFTLPHEVWSSPEVQQYYERCWTICDRGMRCLFELADSIVLDAGQANIGLQLCAINCTETTAMLGEDQITPTCVEASDASVSCYESANCNAVIDGTACRAEEEQADAVCPTVGGANCSLDCDQCTGDTTRSVCRAASHTCATSECCVEVEDLFSECTDGGADGCSFDCSRCMGEPRRLCEGFLDACADLVGDEHDVCCDDVNAIYSIMCGS